MKILSILLGACLMFLINFIFIKTSQGESSMRGLLVGQLHSILTEPVKTQEFLDFIKKNAITELSFYTGGPLKTRVLPSKEAELKALIAKVRSIGVTFISIGVGSQNEMDRVTAFLTGYQVQIQGLWLEFEWWNHSPRDFFTNATTLLKYMRTKAPVGTVIGAYIGWTTQEEMTALIKLVDRVYMHSYVDKGSKLYPKTKSRLEMIMNAAPINKVKVIPIISAEWSPSEICNVGPTHPDYYDQMCFLGPWLRVNGSFDGAENAYWTAEIADRPKVSTTKTWRNYVELKGFYYYNYPIIKDAIK